MIKTLEKTQVKKTILSETEKSLFPLLLLKLMGDIEIDRETFGIEESFVNFSTKNASFDELVNEDSFTIYNLVCNTFERLDFCDGSIIIDNNGDEQSVILSEIGELFHNADKYKNLDKIVNWLNDIEINWREINDYDDFLTNIYLYIINGEENNNCESIVLITKFKNYLKNNC